MLEIKGIAISYHAYAIWVSCSQRILNHLVFKYFGNSFIILGLSNAPGKLFQLRTTPQHIFFSFELFIFYEPTFQQHLHHMEYASVML
jgi:hypothetical protein